MDNARSALIGDLQETFIRTISAGFEFCAHGGLVIVVLGVIWIVERVANVLLGSGKIFKFGKIQLPMQEMFDGADITLLIGLLTVGTLATLIKYRILRKHAHSRAEQKVTGAAK